MKNTIFKYHIVSENKIELPKGAKILCVKAIQNIPYLWAIVDQDSAGTENRKVAVYGTGHPLPEKVGEYLDTFILQGGMFVFHVFDETETI